MIRRLGIARLRRTPGAGAGSDARATGAPSPVRRRPKPKGHPAERRLAAAVTEVIDAGDGRIIAGPWLGELGYEIIYWIPVLRWCVARWPELRERLVVVSRGGVSAWYEGVADTYYDVFDMVDQPGFIERLRADRASRIGKNQNSVKQLEETPWEREIADRVSAELGEPPLPMLHPSLLWSTRAVKRVPALAETDDTVFTRWTRPDRGQLRSILPARYVAVRFARSGLFRSPGFADAVTRAIAERIPVVSLYPGMLTDPQHPDYLSEEGVVSLGPHVSFRDNLAIQSIAIANSVAFVGSFGGLAYVAPHYGVSSTAFWSGFSSGVARDLALTDQVFARPGWGSLTASACDEAPLELLLEPLFEIISSAR